MTMQLMPRRHHGWIICLRGALVWGLKNTIDAGVGIDIDCGGLRILEIWQVEIDLVQPAKSGLFGR